jgi:hypothetical protein
MQYIEKLVQEKKALLKAIGVGRFKPLFQDLNVIVI